MEEKTGLSAYHAILEKAHTYLKKDGYLALEIGYDQKEQVMELFQNTKQYTSLQVRQDLAGNNRVILAKKE